MEAIYFEQLKGFFLSPNDIKSFLSEADETIQHKEELLVSLQKQENLMQEEMDRIYDLYMANQITVQGFGERYKPLEQRRNQLKEEIPELEAQIDFLKVNMLSSDRILSEAHDLYTRWPSLDRDEKRRIVESITEQIIIGEGDVTIHILYLPFDSELMAKGPPNLEVGRYMFDDEYDDHDE